MCLRMQLGLIINPSVQLLKLLGKLDAENLVKTITAIVNEPIVKRQPQTGLVC